MNRRHVRSLAVAVAVRQSLDRCSQREDSEPEGWKNGLRNKHSWEVFGYADSGVRPDWRYQVGGGIPAFMARKHGIGKKELKPKKTCQKILCIHTIYQGLIVNRTISGASKMT